MKLVLLWTCLSSIGSSVSLNHGRDARTGEFPYIVRIQVSEDDAGHDNTSHDEYLQEEATRVATGVLISPVRILTTCDSVGYFTGQKVNMFNTDRITIMGGSVSKDGKGGQTAKPNASSAHPYCYSLLVSKVVLFNYGLYTIPEPFTSPLIKPIRNLIGNKHDLELWLRKIDEKQTSVKCVTASWGNPRKQFEGHGMPDHFERFSTVLQTTELRIVGYDECYKSTCVNFGECLMSIWEYGFVCAQAELGGPCSEDYGAPLVCSGQLVAIHSNPQWCEDPGYPRHFARVDLTYEYIFDVARSESLGPNKFILLAVFFTLLSYVGRLVK